MVRAVQIVLVLLLLFVMGASVHAQMPPLYVDLWLPSIKKELPTFPPCNCVPGAPVCVCSR